MNLTPIIDIVINVFTFGMFDSMSDFATSTLNGLLILLFLFTIVWYVIIKLIKELI